MSLKEITPRENPLAEYGFDGTRPIAEQRLTNIMVKGETAAIRKVKTIYGEDLMAYTLNMRSTDEFLDTFTHIQNHTMTLGKTDLLRMAICIDFFDTAYEIARQHDTVKHPLRYAKRMTRSLFQANGYTGIAIAYALRHSDPKTLSAIQENAEYLALDMV